MKRSIGIVLLGVLASFTLYSQSNHPLLEEDKIWSCYGDFFYHNVKYQIGNDTSINGKSYSKIMAVTSDAPFSFDNSNTHYKSALREENGRIWVVEKNFTTEQLLYDFTKQTGDTIRFYRPIGDFNNGVLPNYVIGKIYKTDYVTLGGVNRKRLFIHDPSIVNMVPVQAQAQLDVQADIWIEGIGSRTGLFQRMPQWGVVGPQPYLLACVEQNAVLIYQFNTGYNAHPLDPCFIIPPGGTTPEEEDSTGNQGNDSLVLGWSLKYTQQSPYIYPNPSTGERFIHFAQVEDGIFYVTIVNALGTFVGKYTCEAIGGIAKINLDEMKPGTYICISERFTKPLRFIYFKE